MYYVCCWSAMTTWPNVLLLIAIVHTPRSLATVLYSSTLLARGVKHPVLVVHGKEATHNELIVGSFNDRARQGGNLRLHVAL